MTMEIENQNFMPQNFIFRPWTSMQSNPEFTDTFLQDKNSSESDCKTRLMSIKYHRSSSNSSIKSTKSITDAERLKRMLSSEKFKNSDKKNSVKNTLSPLDSFSKNDQQQTSKSNQTTNRTNSPASSSAETRLINSRIAALSSASHLLNFETYTRLATPINNQIAAMTAVTTSPTTCQLPMNFLLSNPLPNNLPVLNNSIPINCLTNHSTTNECLLPEIANTNHSNLNLNPLHNQILPIIQHSLQANSPSILTNSLPQANLAPSNSQLPLQQLVPQSPVSMPIQQMPSTTTRTASYSEIISSTSFQQPIVNPPNLTVPNLSQQANAISPLIVEDSRFSNSVLSTSADLLMANLKKMHPGHLPKKNRPKKFFCNHCPANFANNGQLKGHVRTHTGERPFACDFENCFKRFTRNEELTRHKKIHSGEKPFPCEICSKRFGRKDHLKKHIRTHERAAAPQHFAIPYLPPYYYFKV